jgi:hypothetical protein
LSKPAVRALQQASEHIINHPDARNLSSLEISYAVEFACSAAIIFEKIIDILLWPQDGQNATPHAVSYVAWEAVCAHNLYHYQYSGALPVDAPHF